MSLLKSKDNSTKPVIDYYLNQILSNKNIKEDDKSIIIDARKKYRKILYLNGFIFLLSVRQIYKNTNPYDFFNKLNVHTYRFCTFSLLSMICLYYYANNEYYSDTKFLISRHFHVDEKKYNESIINREIINLHFKNKNDFDNLK